MEIISVMFLNTSLCYWLSPFTAVCSVQSVADFFFEADAFPFSMKKELVDPRIRWPLYFQAN